MAYVRSTHRRSKMGVLMVTGSYWELFGAINSYCRYVGCQGLEISRTEKTDLEGVEEWRLCFWQCVFGSDDK